MLVTGELLELIRRHLEAFSREAAKLMKADKRIELKIQCETHEKRLEYL